MTTNIVQRLKNGITAVTPSQRMAGLVADRYNLAMLNASHEAWTAPEVLPFGGWLTDCFQRLALAQPGELVAGMLLSFEQERALWEHVVRASSEVEPEQIENLATLAMNAWSRALLWTLPLSAIAGGDRQEVRAFERWARRFSQRCRDLDAIDQHSFAASLAASRSRVAQAVPPFEFFGHPRLPPLLQQMERSIGAGSNLDRASQETQPEPFSYQAFANSEVELKAVMTWAAEQKGLQPTASVLVALAGVARIDARLEQRLSRVFTTALNDDGCTRGLKFCHATTTPLIELPIIESALLILDWRRNRTWDDVSRLLLTPYLGEAEIEHDQRALLDHEQRRRGDVEVSMTSIMDAARHGQFACPALANRLEAVATVAQGRPRKQRFHEWMGFAEAALTAAGWPGDGELSDIERQALLEWHKVMDMVAQLDAVVAPCQWSYVFGKWCSILRGQQLPRATDIHAVQLVTLEEAAFLDADVVWIAGLHDGAWPDPTDVSPLLPYELQRQYAIPGADPARELLHADTILQRLASLHRNAIWSFARTEGETPRRPLAGHECHRVLPSITPAWPPGVGQGQFRLFDDSHATELQVSGTVSGGVALFTDQAACPMRAFGRHRLHATAPADPTPGLNPMQRGNLIHAVMAAFWTQVRSAARLKQASENEIEQILGACVAEVVAEFRRRYHFVEVYWELERERLFELALEWLQEERARGDFEVIACEESRAASVGSYIINTRVDRVDRLANGDVVIIDYKTGAVPRASWSLPRPDQPQLPLYAVTTGGDSVSGIAYAGLKKGQCKFVDEPQGIGRDTALNEDALTQWTLTTQQWREALIELADEIESGLAVTAPKRGSVTCRFCDLQCLCRIHEAPQRLARQADDEH